MTDRKPPNRRSFLSSVIGAATGGVAFAAVAGAAHARPCARQTGRNDNDGFTGDPGNCGRTNVTDGDSGDPAGWGRATGAVSNMTDRDRSDGIGRGRGGRNGSGVSDNDANDQAGFGRNTSAPRQSGYGGRAFTGRNDSDSGSRADAPGYGR